MNRDQAEQWYQAELQRALWHNASVRGMTAEWDEGDKQAWMRAIRKEWDHRIAGRAEIDETDLESAWDFALEGASNAMRDHFQLKREELEAQQRYDRA